MMQNEDRRNRTTIPRESVRYMHQGYEPYPGLACTCDCKSECVTGLATAAGCQLVATCDIAVCSEHSRFATPGEHVGLFCTTPGVAVGRAVPRKVALEMLFTGQPISAQDALLHGLVSRVVPEALVEEETMKIAHKICTFSKEVTALGKAAFYSQMALEKRAAYKFAERVMVENLGLQASKEGIAAFIEKRKPQFKT